MISDNKDLTLSPRLYFDDNILIQTEYRQANKNSNFISDFSYNKNNNTKSHFFSNFQGKLKNIIILKSMLKKSQMINI